MIESLLNQDEQFDLVSYILDDRVPVTVLPADVEFTTKPATNTKVLSSPGVNISQVEDLLLLRETCGHPEKWEYPSKSEENISSRNSSPQSKLSTSVDDESCTPVKRSRMPSVNHTCDRYRQRRNRNNESSRKSRIKRKSREGEVKNLAKKLERQNESLRIKLDEMEELVKKLRDALLEALGNIKIVSV